MHEANVTMPRAASRAQADPGTTAVELINKLDHLAHGLDALLMLSVSEHLDCKAQAALEFLHSSLDRLWDEITDLAHDLLATLGAQRECCNDV